MSRKKNKIRKDDQELLKKRYSLIALYLVLAVTVLAIFGKTRTFDFAIDDKIIIVENIYVNNGLTSFPKLIKAIVNDDMTVPGVTRPLTMFTHALDISLFGMNPGAHHQMNIFYYLILVFLLFYLLRKYLIPEQPILISFFIVLLFATHPAHVESVANIKGRDDILSFIFGVLALIFFFQNLRYSSILHKTFIFLSLFLSFLSKETGIVFILLIPLSYYYFTKVSLKQAFLSSYLYLIFGVILVIIRFSLFTPPPEYINKYNNSILAFESPFQQFIMSLRILWHYFQISVWPHPLIWDYSFGHFEFDKYTYSFAFASVFVYGGLLLWSTFQVKNKNIISYGILFFLLAISPISNLFVKIATTFGERLLLIPSFGLVIAFVFLLNSFYKKIARKYNYSNDFRLYLFILLVAVGFATLSSSRAAVWQNDDILVQADFLKSKSSRSYKAYIQYETTLVDNKIAHHQTALKACKDALIRFPDDWKLWFFRGIIQTVLNDLNDAKYAYSMSIDVNKDNFMALSNYANLLSNDEPEKAIDLYKKAILIRQNNDIVLGNLAILLHKKGSLLEAKEYYEKSLRLNPGNVKVKRAYGILQETLKTQTDGPKSE